MDQVPATLGKWLQAAPETSFLVTSRERLNVAGESIFELGGPSCPIPDTAAMTRSRPLPFRGRMDP